MLKKILNLHDVEALQNGWWNPSRATLLELREELLGEEIKTISC